MPFFSLVMALLQFFPCPIVDRWVVCRVSCVHISFCTYRVYCFVSLLVPLSTIFCAAFYVRGGHMIESETTESAG